VNGSKKKVAKRTQHDDVSHNQRVKSLFLVYNITKVSLFCILTTRHLTERQKFSFVFKTKVK